MPRFDKHILVCTHERPAGTPRGCCLEKGSEAVLMKFKELISSRRPPGVVRANKSGCLDQCACGVTVVVYPEAVWYGGVTVNDVEEIFERHIVGGETVERLVIPDSLLNTPESKGLPPK